MRSITGLQELLGRGGFTTVVVLTVAVLLLVVGAMRRRGWFGGARAVATLSLAAAVAGVFALTLIGPVPSELAEPRLYVDPVQGARGWDGIAWRPVFDNVVLFVPVGALAAAALPRRSVLAVWLGCVALSIAVETFQYVVPTGRVANAADVVANATGAAIGVLAASLLGTRRSRRRRARARDLRASVRG